MMLTLSKLSKALLVLGVLTVPKVLGAVNEDFDDYAADDEFGLGSPEFSSNRMIITGSALTAACLWQGYWCTQLKADGLMYFSSTLVAASAGAVVFDYSANDSPHGANLLTWLLVVPLALSTSVVAGFGLEGKTEEEHQQEHQQNQQQEREAATLASLVERVGKVLKLEKVSDRVEELKSIASQEGYVCSNEMETKLAEVLKSTNALVLKSLKAVDASPVTTMEAADEKKKAVEDLKSFQDLTSAVLKRGDKKKLLCSELNAAQTEFDKVQTAVMKDFATQFAKKKLVVPENASIDEAVKLFKDAVDAFRHIDPLSVSERQSIRLHLDASSDSIMAHYKELLTLPEDIANAESYVIKIDNVLRLLEPFKDLMYKDIRYTPIERRVFGDDMDILRAVRDTLQPPTHTDLIAQFKELKFSSTSTGCNADVVVKAIVRLSEADDFSKVKYRSKDLFDQLLKEVDECKKMTRGAADDTDRAARISWLIKSLSSVVHCFRALPKNADDEALITADDITTLERVHATLASKTGPDQDLTDNARDASQDLDKADLAKLKESYLKISKAFLGGAADSTGDVKTWYEKSFTLLKKKLTPPGKVDLNLFKELKKNIDEIREGVPKVTFNAHIIALNGIINTAVVKLMEWATGELPVVFKVNRDNLWKIYNEYLDVLEPLKKEKILNPLAQEAVVIFYGKIAFKFMSICQEKKGDRNRSAELLKDMSDKFRSHPETKETFFYAIAILEASANQ